MALKIPFNAVQRALYELLSKGQTVPVTEHIPTGQEEFPYIWIGASNDVPENDNKTNDIHLLTQEIDLWSDQGGTLEINNIMNDVIFLVTHYKLRMPGYHVINLSLIHI